MRDWPFSFVYVEVRNRMRHLVVIDGLFWPGSRGVLLATFPDHSESGLVALLGSGP